MSEVVSKILKGELLTEGEASEIVYEGYDDIEIIDNLEGEESRWHRGMQTIFSINGELWAIDWGRGLTEYQENDFYGSQPYRVEKRERQITITEYVEVKDK